MSQTIEVSTREEQIREVLPIFEDRLASRPGSPAWAELSRMLSAAPPSRPSAEPPPGRASRPSGRDSQEGIDFINANDIMV